MHQSINKKEIEKFAKLSYDWWNSNGKFSALHRINPLRMKFILDIDHHKVNSFTPKDIIGMSPILKKIATIV